MATEAHNTGRTDAPTVTSLAQHIQHLDALHDRAEAVEWAAYVKGNRAAPLQNHLTAPLMDQMIATRDLLLVTRPRTLAEALAQLAHADLETECMAVCQAEERLKNTTCRTLQRVFAATLPLIADAAGVTIAEVMGESYAHTLARHAPPELMLGGGMQ